MAERTIRDRFRPDGLPVRNNLESMSPVELEIYHLVHKVEALGVSTALTDAVVLLGKARDRVADHLEGIE